MDHQIQALLNAKDEQIKLQEVQIELLKDMVEQRRLALTHQSRELADHRDLHQYSRKSRWGFFWWLALNNIWPFSIWYHRFD
jgi:hypothetical protein